MPVTVWKGQLTFGLVSIPIRIIRAARQEQVRFRQVYRAPEAEPEAEAAPAEASRRGARPAAAAMVKPVEVPTNREATPSREPAGAAAARIAEPAPVSVAPVRRVFAAPDTGETVAPAEVLKGYEYEKGRFAVFRAEELRRLRAETTRDMEIIEFVKLGGIDPVYFNASYYVTPDRGGDKPYGLLFEAMRRTGYAAIARFAMHGREQMAALRPGGRGIIMHTLFFESEIHAQDEFSADGSLVTPQEMKLAELLISQLAAEFDASKFSNEKLARIRASIQEKIAGGKTGAAKETAAAPAPVIDILDALRRSLERKKGSPERKPAAKEAAAKRRPRQHKAGA